MTHTERAREYRAKIEAMAQHAPDDAALSEPSLFPQWKVGIPCTAGRRVQHGGALYRCLQGHTSQADWSPAAAVSLWTKIDAPEIEWPEIRNPITAENPYSKGDKCQKNGQKYISLIDTNVWQPEDYPAGWEKVNA